jgi:FMN phosphatase YigB (HAD superfamily)
MNENFSNAFDGVFAKYKEVPVALYGIGKNAEKIIKNTKGYNIVGLIAKDHIGEIVFGKEVLSLEDAIKKAKVIIIAATSLSTTIIYNRIKYAVPDTVLLYDVHGHRINGENFYENDPYWQKSYDGLLAEIDCHEVISFDVFDTLLMRRVLEPRDIFLLVERSLHEEGIDVPFAAWRIHAEVDLLRNVEHPDLDDIYLHMQELYKIDDRLLPILKVKELDREERCVCAREKMADAFAYAKHKGKVVYLVSDMYLNKRYMEKLLRKCGIVGYRDLMISCELNASKGRGDIYELLLQKERHSHILHIGDNQFSDIKNAEKNGIDAFFVMNAYEMLLQSDVGEIHERIESFDDKLLLGNVVATMLNDPFALHKFKGKIYIDDAKMMAKICFAAITMVFMAWFVNEVKGKKNAVILFVSRDGYYLQKLYQRIKNKLDLPDDIYFYSSRVAASLSGMKDEKDIKNIWKSLFLCKDMNLKDYLALRFGIVFSEKFDLSIEKALDTIGYEGIEKAVLESKDEILLNASKIRRNYLKYIAQLKLEKYDQIYITDIVTQGTTMYGLANVLNRSINLLAYGTYNMPNSHIPDMKYVKSLFGNAEGFIDFFNMYVVLELAYASDEGQFCGINDYCQKIFMDSTAYDGNLITSLQEGIDEFIKDYEEIDADWFNKTFSTTLGSFVFGILKKANIEENLKNKFSFFDCMIGNINILQEIKSKSS